MRFSSSSVSCIRRYAREREVYFFLFLIMLTNIAGNNTLISVRSACGITGHPVIREYYNSCRMTNVTILAIPRMTEIILMVNKHKLKRLQMQIRADDQHLKPGNPSGDQIFFLLLRMLMSTVSKPRKKRNSALV